jgi:hypothetical protein
MFSVMVCVGYSVANNKTGHGIQNLEKLNIELPCDPGITPAGIYPK